MALNNRFAPSPRPKERAGDQALAKSHRRDRWPLPMKVRPDVSASLAATFANKPQLEIGKPDVIRPLVCAGGRSERLALGSSRVRQSSKLSFATRLASHRSEQDETEVPGPGMTKPLIWPMALALSRSWKSTTKGPWISDASLRAMSI